MPWLTALRTRCSSGSSIRSTTTLSISVDWPWNTSRTCLPDSRIASRAAKRRRSNTSPTCTSRMRITPSRSRRSSRSIPALISPSSSSNADRSIGSPAGRSRRGASDRSRDRRRAASRRRAGRGPPARRWRSRRRRRRTVNGPPRRSRPRATSRPSMQWVVVRGVPASVPVPATVHRSPSSLHRSSGCTPTGTATRKSNATPPGTTRGLRVEQRAERPQPRAHHVHADAARRERRAGQKLELVHDAARCVARRHAETGPARVAPRCGVPAARAERAEERVEVRRWLASAVRRHAALDRIHSGEEEVEKRRVRRRAGARAVGAAKRVLERVGNTLGAACRPPCPRALSACEGSAGDRGAGVMAAHPSRRFPARAGRASPWRGARHTPRSSLR